MDNLNEQNIINEEELSYEEEQLQLLLIKESMNIKLNNEKNLKQQQDLEYQESLKNDLDNLNQKNIEFEEISLKEMRDIRLKRFEKKNN